MLLDIILRLRRWARRRSGVCSGTVVAVGCVIVFDLFASLSVFLLYSLRVFTLPHWTLPCGVA